MSSHQSGFKGGDSYINQLLSITHEIYKSFDESFEVREVFLDISKAFDRVWHDDLTFKPQENEISGKSRKQRVVLNGQLGEMKMQVFPKDQFGDSSSF